MTNARWGFLAFLRYQHLRAPLGALVLWPGLGLLNPALARAPYDKLKPAESWASSQIKRGEIDFNQRCDTPQLDPKNEEDERWQKDCRKISSRFLVNLLTETPQDAVPFAGVRIIGAWIANDVDLANAKLSRAIEITHSRIDGAIRLSHAQTDSPIALAGSLIRGSFDADGLRAHSDLSLGQGAAFKADVSLARHSDPRP